MVGWKETLSAWLDLQTNSTTKEADGLFLPPPPPKNLDRLSLSNDDHTEKWSLLNELSIAKCVMPNYYPDNILAYLTVLQYWKVKKQFWRFGKSALIWKSHVLRGRTPPTGDYHVKMNPDIWRGWYVLRLWTGSFVCQRFRKNQFILLWNLVKNHDGDIKVGRHWIRRGGGRGDTENWFSRLWTFLCDLRSLLHLTHKKIMTLVLPVLEYEKDLRFLCLSNSSVGVN